MAAPSVDCSHNPPITVDGELVDAYEGDVDIDVQTGAAWIPLRGVDTNRSWDFDLLSGELVDTTVHVSEPRSSYPFFVYGTLRRGEHNYRRLLAETSRHERRASLKGASMYAGPGFPYIARGAGTVSGELIWVDDNCYEATLSRLDRLEGYDKNSAVNHYDRVLSEVTTDTGEPVTAWVYFAGELVDLQRLQPINSGDWLADVCLAAAS